MAISQERLIQALRDKEVEYRHDIASDLNDVVDNIDYQEWFDIITDLRDAVMDEVEEADRADPINLLWADSIAAKYINKKILDWIEEQEPRPLGDFLDEMDDHRDDGDLLRPIEDEEDGD